MTKFLDRVATESPADLIAGEAVAFKSALTDKYPVYWVRDSVASDHRIRRAEAVAELRHAWTLAHRGDEEWRTALGAFLDAHGEAYRTGALRLRLVIEHSPRPVVA